MNSLLEVYELYTRSLHWRPSRPNEDPRRCSGVMAEGMEAIGSEMAKVEKWKSRGGHGMLGERIEREFDKVGYLVYERLVKL